MKRMNIVREVKIIHVAVSTLLLLSGVLIIAWKGMDHDFVRYLIGCDFIVTGAVRVLGYFANDLYRLAFQHDLALGTFCVILGVLIMIYPENVISALPYAIGIFAIVDGLLKLQTAFDAKNFGMKQWGGLLSSAVTLVLCGGAVLIFSTNVDLRMLFVGIALAVDGAENMWNTMGTVRIRAKKKNRFEDEL